MTKKTWIALFVLPMLRPLAAWLRAKDANSTGVDDEAADAIDYTVNKLEKYLEVA